MMDIKLIAICLAAGAMSPAALAFDHKHDHEKAQHEDEHDHEDHAVDHSDEHAHDDHDDDDDDHEEHTSAGSAHVHGVWSLFAAVDDNALSVTLTGPLNDVLGFESAPSTEEEEAAVAAMLANLSDADALLTTDPAGNCSLEGPVEVALPEGFEAHDDESEAHDHASEDDHEHAAADAEVTINYVCDRPQNVRSLTVNMFSAYGSIETIEAVFLADDRQVSSELSPDDRVLKTR